MSRVLAVFIVLTVLLLVALVMRPNLLADRTGRLLSFVAFLLFPAVITYGGTAQHLSHAKTTKFCLSCHEMEPYGKTLWLDDPESLHASHFQNGRIPRGQACYTCHTQYTMFGDVNAKLAGLQHVWVHFFGAEIQPGDLQLYSPYKNRECLHCHEGSRSFVESAGHEGLFAELRTNGFSCLDCHAGSHSVTELDGRPMWKPPEVPEP